MKRAVLKFTACCLAAGMTFGANGSVALASKDTVLAGFGASVSEPQTVTGVVTERAESAEETEEAQEAAVETEAPQTEAVQAEAPQTEAPQTEAPQTEPAVDTSMSGERAFAQCEEYINVRSSASADSEVVGKVYNNGSVTILSQVGDWYEVQSGNAVGYVKAEFFAIGAEADAIAEEVAYNVATVYPEALVIRSEPSEDSESIGMAYSSDELEVVQYEGDWMKVALGNDVYGYVNAYYVDYDTYYATAETLEEEQARLDAEWIAYLEQQEAERIAAEQAYLEAIAAQEAQAAADAAAAEAAYQAQLAAQAQQQASASTQTSSDAQAEADQAYQEYLDAQAAADAATQTADEQAVYDTAAQAQQEYEEFLAAQAIADQAAVDQVNAAAQEQAAADAAAQQAAADQAAADAAAAQAAADAAAQAQAEAEAAAQAQAEAEAAAQAAAQQQAAASSTGQQIVNFATQFVGNPYVWGGTSLTNGADCSGFTQSVMANFGISIPRTAASQSGSGTPVDLSEIQAGDLLFYSGGSGINHVTIYMGNGQVVHASSSTTGIIISDYGYRTPVSARRYW